MASKATIPVMACPVCLTGLAMAERQGIEIDYCPTCRGVWLDRGELDNIIERSVAEAQAPQYRSGPPPPWPAGDPYRGDQHGHYRTRKKSFLKGLFD